MVFRLVLRVWTDFLQASTCAARALARLPDQRIDLVIYSIMLPAGKIVVTVFAHEVTRWRVIARTAHRRLGFAIVVEA